MKLNHNSGFNSFITFTIVVNLHLLKANLIQLPIDHKLLDVREQPPHPLFIAGHNSTSAPHDPQFRCPRLWHLDSTGPKTSCQFGSIFNLLDLLLDFFGPRHDLSITFLGVKIHPSPFDDMRFCFRTHRTDPHGYIHSLPPRKIVFFDHLKIQNWPFAFDRNCVFTIPHLIRGLFVEA